MQFVMIAHDRPDAAALRRQVRPDHLAYIETIPQNVVFGGPLLDDEGNPRGSIIVYEAADRAALDALIANDPYTRANLFGTVEISGFRTVVRDGVVIP